MMNENASRRSKLLHWAARVGLGGALLGVLTLGSCGKARDGSDNGEPELLLDSNTNWLKRCEIDAECSGSLRCYCGQCSQPCAGNDECALLDGAQCVASGPALCGQQAGAGALCVLGCAGGPECGADFTCSSGQCVPKSCEELPLQSWDDIYASLYEDLSVRDLEDAIYSRYFSVANARCADSADTQRQALIKLLNSTSINARATQPVAVDADSTLYRIDLRDFDWDRPFELGGSSFPNVWEALIARNPQALHFVGDSADDARVQTGTAAPVMFVNGAVAALTQSDLYYAVTSMPDQVASLAELLGLSPDFLEAPEFQAGFSDGAEFIAQQWDVQGRRGFIWQISELGRGAGALFDDPLATPVGEREILYTLPNGVLAFAFASPSGERLERWNATSDPRERDGRASAPRSNFRRHARNLAIRDEVRSYLEENPERFTPEAAAIIRERYAGSVVLGALLAQHDGRTWEALGQGGVDPALPEPITAVYERHDDSLTLNDAAAELLILPDDLDDELDNLDPALGVLEAGRISRGEFSRVYVHTACIIHVTLENQVDPALCDDTF